MKRLQTNPLVQLTLMKLRELIREPEALFWVFVFPLLLALALGVAFRSGEAPPILVGVQDGAGAPWIQQTLAEAEGIESRVLDAAEARRQISAGKVALVVVPGEPWIYWFDPTRPDSRLARLAVDDALQRGAGRIEAHEVGTRRISEKGSRYIDFLIPGLLGMNLMGTGMWGIGFNIVSARAKRLLKRLVATPMRRTDFLLAQIGGRLLFLVLEVGVIVLFARLVFEVPLRGSVGALCAVSLLGALTFGGLGLLVSSRAQTIEGVSGLMNFVMMPMWICSGTFFSTARFPDGVQPLIQLLPLTAVNDALRGVMLDGASLVELSGEMLIAGAWGAGAFGLALLLFRWT